jgi:hypothetical protein
MISFENTLAATAFPRHGGEQQETSGLQNENV